VHVGICPVLKFPAVLRGRGSLRRFRRILELVELYPILNLHIDIPYTFLHQRVGLTSLMMV
jgi:hypothetical protein